ncbi:MAG: DUF4340 domain-containing protein [Deltaproteobacteria bacterium]|nr:DUF4340 domain-containing protein [Deltaproteobacteria bacterium]
MSLKKTLVLAAVLAAAVIYIWRVEIPRTRENEQKGVVFRNIDRDEIKSLGITTSGESFELVNSAPRKTEPDAAGEVDEFSAEVFKSWQLGAVPGSTLDPAVVSSLVSGILKLKLDEPLPKDEVEQDLSAYGLKSPELSIKLRTLDNSYELLFGKLNSYFNQRYFKLGDSEAVYLVPEFLYSAANKKAEDFRDRTPIEFIDSDVEKISIRSKQGEITIQPGEPGEWRITHPIESAASGQAIAGITRTLRNLRAEGFVNDLTELKKYGLEDPEISVEIHFKETAARQPISLAISSVADSADKSQETSYAYIKGLPSIYELSIDPSKGLVKTPAEIREKSLLKFALDSVARVEIEKRDTAKISLVRDGETWTVNQKPGDKAFINQLLTDLSRLEAKDFPADSPSAGLDKPHLKISLHFSGADTQDLTLVVGNAVQKDGSLRFASISKVPYLIAISEEDVKKISPREEVLVPVPPAAEQSPSEQP